MHRASAMSSENIGSGEERFLVLAASLSEEVPSQILAELCDVQRSRVTYLVSYLGARTSKRQQRKVYKHFLSTEQPIASNVLTKEERRELQVLRHRNRVRQQMADEGHSRLCQLIMAFHGKVPASVIGEMAGYPMSTVREWRAALGLDSTVAFSLQTRLRFLSENPESLCAILSVREKESLFAAWHRIKKARRIRQQNEARALEQRLAEQLSQALKDDAGLLPRLACTGENCGAEYPRSEKFFHAEVSAADGFSRRCKLCVLKESNQRRFSNQPRKSRNKKNLTGKTRQRLRSLICRLSNVLPSAVLQELFSIGEGTLLDLRREGEVKITSAQAKKLQRQWRWVKVANFRPLLSVEQQNRLDEIWRREHHALLELLESPGPMYDFLCELRAEREASGLKSDKICVHGCTRNANGERVNERWPATEEFFVKRYGKNSGTLSNQCKSCYGREQRRALLMKERKQVLGS